MGRVSTAALPTVDPDRDALLRAASLFEAKGRYSLNGTDIQLMVNGRIDDSFIDDLFAAFGGALYAVGAGRRWQVTGERLREFLQRIDPFLTRSGQEKADGFRLATEAIDLLRGTARSRSARMSRVTERPRMDTFKLMEGLDELQLELVLEDPTIVEVAPDGRRVFEARTGEHALQWTAALRTAGWAVSVEYGVIIFGTPPAASPTASPSPSPSPKGALNGTV